MYVMYVCMYVCMYAFMCVCVPVLSGPRSASVVPAIEHSCLTRVSSPYTSHPRKKKQKKNRKTKKKRNNNKNSKKKYVYIYMHMHTCTFLVAVRRACGKSRAPSFRKLTAPRLFRSAGEIGF